jgi:hypothetical protein
LSALRTKLSVAVTYLVLLALVVPWYWPAGDVRHVLGVPLWALATLLALLLTAIFTAWIYLSTDDREPD